MDQLWELIEIPDQPVPRDPDHPGPLVSEPTDDPDREATAPAQAPNHAQQPDSGPASPPPGPLPDAVVGGAGPTGLRLELCGPVRLLRASDDGDLRELPSGQGLSPGQLSLLAYLGLTTVLGGGVDAATAATEFRPAYHPDGSLRPLRPDAVKGRVWSLRRALAGHVRSENPKDALPDMTDKRYRLLVTCDWDELAKALQHAERTAPGTPEVANTIDTILALVRPPGLLTPPSDPRSWAWLEHYGPLIQDTARRIQHVLARHATHLASTDQCPRALDILSQAKAVAPTVTRPIAAATVAALLAAGDPAAAQAEVDAYEAQLGPDLAAHERERPAPGSPRAVLNQYREPS